MTTTHRFLTRSLAAILLFVCAAPAYPANAATLTDPYAAYVAAEARVQSAQVMAEYGLVLADGDEPLFVTHTEVSGTAKRIGGDTYDSQMKVTATVADEESGIEATMDFIRKGDTIYVKFKDHEERAIRNKWISMDADDFEDFAAGFSEESGLLIQFADLSQSARDADRSEDAVDAAIDLDVYVPYSASKSDKVAGVKATRYELEFDRGTVAAYFRELEDIYEDDDGSIFAIEGVSAGLSNRRFLDELVEESYVKIWFDQKTGLPVRYEELVHLPAFGDRDEAMVLFSATELTKINKKVNVKAPKSSMTLDQAEKLLD